MTEHEQFDNDGVATRGRNKLVSRAVLVVALIVALLAGLMIFEGKSDRPEVSEAAPVAAALNAPRIGVSVSAAPTTPAAVPESMPEELKRAIREAPDAAQATLASMSAPAASSAPSQTPVVPEGSSDVPTKPLATPATPVHSPLRAGRDSHPQAPTLATSAGRTEPVRASSAASPALSEARDAGPFILQVGVFSNPGNAEELRNKLRQAGIPTQLETRVQVGPFSSKEEAVKAQDRLKKLGIGGGMLLPTSTKRP
ncbi:SPOR domain-containing protein [Uliginosibacterium aquaticum]|uniref:SPOR domain-containing protein n=1 Tax=Uliginosibacterium aquaticum TaxID=2731212 RepID=A0ABX2IKH0_9RHOO|nr:SPOR domain-containing protein [Uliginosibacterium aquaticum]NSL56383.1 SPOR domain-containing protein [Uliginosibacterium aquaticum]